MQKGTSTVGSDWDEMMRYNNQNILFGCQIKISTSSYNVEVLNIYIISLSFLIRNVIASKISYGIRSFESREPWSEKGDVRDTYNIRFFDLRLLIVVKNYASNKVFF